MSATVDVNVLVSAVNESDPHRDECIALVEGLATGPALWHLFWPVLSGFARIATNPAIFPRPLSVRQAMEIIDGLTSAPTVRVHGELDGFYQLFEAAQHEASGGPDVPDAHIVALMRQHGVSTIYTRDRGFRRFDGITVREPAAA